MQRLRNAGLALLLLAMSGSSAVAQGIGDWEWGLDILAFSLNKADGASSSTTNIGLNPGSVLRVGKQVTANIMVEPNVSFSRSSDDTFTSSSTALSVAAVWMFMAMEEGKPGWYVRPEVGLAMSKFESGGSTVFDETRTHFGAGAGMKRDAMGMIWRVEAFFNMMPKKDTSPSETEFGIKVGAGAIKKKKM